MPEPETFSFELSPTSRKIVTTVSKLFQGKDGLRALGKIRLEYNEDTGAYALTGYLGRHNGPPIDLTDREPETSISLADDRSRVLEAIKPFTDHEILSAMSTAWAWTCDKVVTREDPNCVIEYSEGNPDFAAEGIRGLADLIRDWE